MRKYVLTKLDKGDYVCPSNDGETLWRFRSYEDGKCLGLDVDFERRTFWRVQRTMVSDAGESAEFAEEARWVDVHYWLPTRKAAIASVFGDDQ